MLKKLNNWLLIKFTSVAYITLQVTEKKYRRKQEKGHTEKLMNDLPC